MFHPAAAVPPETAVLLVLLPPAGPGPHHGQTAAWLRTLQARLGPTVRVLPVDEASHPAVVRSFAPAALPACVLMRQGVELWRQQGLLTDEGSVLALLQVAQVL